MNKFTEHGGRFSSSCDIFTYFNLYFSVTEEKIKEDEETNIVELDVESENSEKDEASAEKSQFFDVEGVKKCDLCCDIDIKVKRCKLCERAWCEGCSDQHFDMVRFVHLFKKRYKLDRRMYSFKYNKMKMSFVDIDLEIKVLQSLSSG